MSMKSPFLSTTQGIYPFLNSIISVNHEKRGITANREILIPFIVSVVLGIIVSPKYSTISNDLCENIKIYDSK